MENATNPTKKMNTFMISHKNDNPKQGNNENSAKESLFEVSEVETPIPLQMRIYFVNKVRLISTFGMRNIITLSRNQ